MKYEEYVKTQSKTSTWTRKSKTAKWLATDAVNQFSKYVPKGTTVLELGCGDGFAMDKLKERGYKVFGCDINESKVAKAKTFGHKARVEDLHSLTYTKGGFDAVYCTHTLEHSYDGYKAFEEIYRVLKNNGVAFVIVPDHEHLYGDLFKDRKSIPSLKDRDSWYFEKMMKKASGITSKTNRNQFPFTDALLLDAATQAGLRTQVFYRMKRAGVELWLVATKTKGNSVPTILNKKVKK